MDLHSIGPRHLRPRLAEAGAGGRARVERDPQVDREKLLIDTERVVKNAKAVADVVEDVLAGEAVVVAAADGGGVRKQRPGEAPHGREVQKVPVEARDVVVAKLNAGDGVGPAEQRARQIAAQPLRPGRVGQLHRKPDVAEGGAACRVEAEHVPRRELEEAQRSPPTRRPARADRPPSSAVSA